MHKENLEEIKKEFDDLFIPVICDIVKRYNKQTKNNTAKKLLKAALRQVIRKWTDKPVNKVSEKAYNLIVKQNINPYQLAWSDEKYRKSLKLKWEHMSTVEELIQKLTTVTNYEECKNILLNYPGVCIITEDEDISLKQHGYNSKRPGGWEKCYEDCNIKLK